MQLENVKTLILTGANQREAYISKNCTSRVEGWETNFFAYKKLRFVIHQSKKLD